MYGGLVHAGFARSVGGTVAAGMGRGSPDSLLAGELPIFDTSFECRFEPLYEELGE